MGDINRFISSTETTDFINSVESNPAWGDIQYMVLRVHTSQCLLHFQSVMGLFRIVTY